MTALLLVAMLCGSGSLGAEQGGECPIVDAWERDVTEHRDVGTGIARKRYHLFRQLTLR
ncbi:MAG: hypothetical protein GZ085_04365 [Sulfuriferula multivorans]|uniref:Uncharacterized protein n=1 Tax=Sulfuriferula multivorans TaxID=1559896 RepID=A0A7C9NSD9_9PROT|nr:hypothetical protein [Sulfuriferula multivorans]